MSITRESEMLPSIQRRNLRFVVIDGVFIGLMSAAASFVSVFVVRLGASPLWVSLLSSLPSTIRLLMTIPWSAFVSRQRHPEQILGFARLAVHIVYPLIAVVPFFLREEAAARLIVIIWSLSAFPSSLSGMMFTLVMGHAVPPHRRAFLMSRRWMFLGVAKLVALPLISQVIDRLPLPGGYQLIFAMNALFAIGAFYCAMHIDVPERTPAAPSTRQPIITRLRSGWENTRRETAFLAFIGGRATLNIGLSLIAAIVPIYWVNHLDASDTWVGYFNAALSGATLLSYFPWVRIKRKYGTRRTLLPAVLGTTLYPALLTLARAPAAVLPVIAFNGFAGAGLNLAFFDALLENCPPDKEAQFVAINMAAVNLTGIIGPPVGAALLGVMDIRWVLVCGTFISLAGFAVFALVRPKRAIPASRS